ncbi:MAG: hypothetical protein D3910_28285 [Candidatus Electrothrix sp. ATG2]|nr:hypothetical protein [Candidatus Electrothrix sp. ATG2]
MNVRNSTLPECPAEPIAHSTSQKQNATQTPTNQYPNIDKTQYLYELIRYPKGVYFLSRPRRFGNFVCNFREKLCCYMPPKK